MTDQSSIQKTAFDQFKATATSAFKKIESTLTQPPRPAPTTDTPTAERALRLADAHFMSAVQDIEPDNLPQIRSHLALAAKQLDIAHKADPNATATITHDGEEGTLTQSRLRSRVLQLEALTWSAEKPTKAISIASQAAHADPADPQAYYFIGKLLLEHRNKPDAVRALQRACELEPDNIEYAQYLDRAQNLSKAEIASYRLSHGADQGIVAVAKTGRILKIIGRLCLVAIALSIAYSIAVTISDTNHPFVPNFIIGSLFCLAFVFGLWIKLKEFVGGFFGGL